MRVRHPLTVAVFLTVGATLAGCTAASAEGSAADSNLTIGSVVDVTSWNPADVGGGHFLQYMQPVYDTLLQVDSKGAIEPDLATEWRWDEARTTLTLDLRTGVKFTDGTRFDADAVVANVTSLKAGSGAASSQLRSVKDATAVDDDTVALNLSQPDPALETALTQNAGFMASPKGISAGTLATEPVGTGPYTLDAKTTTVGSEYAFVRNAEYWAPKTYPFDRITIRPLTDDSARRAALQSGAIDAGIGQPAWVKEISSDQLIAMKYTLDFMGLFIDDRAGTLVPALGDVRVRQAINYAFDRAAILKTIQLGYGEETTQVFSKSSIAYDAKLNKVYSYDPDRARKLLKEAGYADGFDLPMPSSDWSAAYDAVVLEQLAAVGIRVKYESIPTTNVLSRLPDFGAHWFGWAMPQNPWVTVTDLIAKDGVGNYQHSTDPEIDALMSEILVTPTEKAGPLYKKLNARVVDQAWFAPWYGVSQVYFHSSSVEVDPPSGVVVPAIKAYRPAS
ncbi:MAG TPA: ABC transporter substrate-binding protein [Pseudolysinimonas sp.]|nr:ABC transporter substrate-binding protein [Pseudolysinimonas sp.]